MKRLERTNNDPELLFQKSHNSKRELQYTQTKKRHTPSCQVG